MTDSAHNIQKELTDVNNLWRWPTSYTKTDSVYQPFSIFVPELWRWKSFAVNGYWQNISSTVYKCRFTDKSVSTILEGGYSAGTFMDLHPGKYVMSFDVDSETRVFITYYLMRDEGKVEFGNNRTTYNTYGSGSYMFGFEIPDGCCAVFSFGLDDTKYVTMTNIVIKEGVL